MREQLLKKMEFHTWCCKDNFNEVSSISFPKWKEGNKELWFAFSQSYNVQFVYNTQSYHYNATKYNLSGRPKSGRKQVSLFLSF